MTYALTDIHQHLLWGMDDGAASPEITRRMMKDAARQGIGKIAATCHVRPGIEPFDPGRYRERLAQAREICRSERLPLQICSGAEIAWTYQTETALRQGRLPTLGNTDYVLLELWTSISPRDAYSAAKSLIGAGYCPVIAHAERYLCFLCSPRFAQRFRAETGALLQVNAEALLKPANLLEKRFVRNMLDSGAIDAIASDAHGNARRPINLRAAHDWLLQHTDAAYARSLTTFSGELK